MGTMSDVMLVSELEDFEIDMIGGAGRKNGGGHHGGGGHGGGGKKDKPSIVIKDVNLVLGTGFIVDGSVKGSINFQVG